MGDFLQFSKVLLITLVTLTVSDSQARANSVSRNEKRTIVVGGVLRSRSFTAPAATGDVTKTAMTSSEDGSTAGAGDSTNSMEEQFLRRLGLERISLRRSKRSNAVKDAVPGYLTEILKKFQRQTRKNWNRLKQTEQETIVTGVMPYKVFSVDSETVKVHFHLNAVLKMESMALAEVVVRRQSHAATLKEREGRVNIRSLVFCREAEANESSSSSSSSSSSCRILAHKPVARHRHFDVYDITRSMQDLRAELQSSMSGSDGGDCPDCFIVMTMMVQRGDTSDVISGLSDVLLVISNQPISDSVLNENSVGTVRQTNGRIDRSERTPTAKDLKITKIMELRDTKRDSSRRRQRREVVACSLRSWYVDFARIGWTSWIRFPLGYYANYCSGSCVSPSQGNPGSNMTNHAYVKGLYRTALQQNNNNNNNTVHQALIDALPATCCVPVRLSSLKILYRNDDDNWIISSMSEMVATQCGCL